MAKKSKKKKKSAVGGRRSEKSRELAREIGAPGNEKPTAGEIRKRNEEKAAAVVKHRKDMEARQAEVDKQSGKLKTESGNPKAAKKKRK